MSSLYRKAEGSRVIGDVSFGADCSVWYNAVIRGDSSPIVIGDRSNIQDCCVLHTDKEFPIHLGDDVTVGHGAIVHGCSVGDNTVVGMGAILLNGCKVGRNSIVAAGALVPQNKEFPDGVLLMGSPVKVIRELTEEEIRKNLENAQAYVEEGASLPLSE